MRIRTVFALCLLLALGVAGCGGADKDDGVATAGSPGSNATSSAAPDDLSEQERALKFAQCMRDNGVPNWPDPKIGDGGGMSIDAPEGADPNKIQAAMQACRRYMPNGGEPQKLDPQRLEQLRKFAQCMRDNGIKNFPDPTDEGLQINGNTSSFDPNNPKFQAAQKKCETNLPAGPSGAPSPGLQSRSNG